MSPEITLVRPIVAAQPRMRLALHVPYAVSGLMVVVLSSLIARDVTPVIGAGVGLGSAWLIARVLRRDLTPTMALAGAAIGNLVLVTMALGAVAALAVAAEATMPAIFWRSAAVAAAQGLLIAVGASTVVRSLIRGPRRVPVAA